MNYKTCNGPGCDGEECAWAEFDPDVSRPDMLAEFCRRCTRMLAQRKKNLEEKKENPMSTMKICAKCLKSKPLDEFGKAKNSKDGLTAACKLCRNAALTAIRHAAKAKDQGTRSASAGPTADRPAVASTGGATGAEQPERAPRRKTTAIAVTTPAPDLFQVVLRGPKNQEEVEALRRAVATIYFEQLKTVVGHA